MLWYPWQGHEPCFGDGEASFRYENEPILTNIITSLIFLLLFHYDVWKCSCYHLSMLWYHSNNQVWLPHIDDTPFHTCSPILSSIPTTSSISLISVSFDVTVTILVSEQPSCSTVIIYDTRRLRDGEENIGVFISGTRSLRVSIIIVHLICITLCDGDVLKLHWLCMDCYHGVFLLIHDLWEY
jgi:hypothetical protein